MYPKNKIYDITALEIFKRLEVFFTDIGIPEFVPVPGTDRTKPREFTKRIEEFELRHSRHEDILDIGGWMRAINKTRNRIVHPSDVKDLVDKSIEPIATLCRDDFREFRGDCLELDRLLRQPPFEKHTGMSEIMIPTLQYEMGNLGDIIKHGLLAVFVDWWCGTQGKPRMIVADTFAGCPWGGNQNIDSRMKNLARASNNNAILSRAYKQGKTGGQKYPLYLGSSHLVRRIAKNHDKEMAVLASDHDEDARDNLRASGLRLLALPNGNDGFMILNDVIFDKCSRPHLILLDPYGEFLREEFHSQFNRFREIEKLTASNPSLWVALFVLDMWPEIGKKSRRSVQETHDLYTDCRDAYFRHKAVYLHCPKAKESRIKGEKEYDTEILLISEQLRNKDAPDIADLLRRLQTFAQQATAALIREPGLILSGNQKVEYHEV